MRASSDDLDQPSLNRNQHSITNLLAHAGNSLGIPASSLTSPFPHISPGGASPRQRAQTFANTNSLQPNSPYRTNMHTPYRPGQQLPPPPPPQNGPQGSSLGMALPPPPPMSMRQPQQHTLMIPPPPSNPPSAHPTYWNRQASYPPPPNTSGPVPYNPGAYQQQLQQQQQPQSESLVSATYIPGSDGWGPGVGIPPLYPLPKQESSYDSGYGTGTSTYNSSMMREVQVATPIEDGRWTGNGTYSNLHRAPSRNIQASYGYASPAPPAATLQHPQHPSPRQKQAEPLSARPPLSPSDPGSQWPVEKVMMWLAQQGFSKDWQETFKVLNLHGSQFLDIGRGHGTKGNVAMMHSVIFPQLAALQGGNWDQGAEREEGKRLRRLVRKIVETGAAGVSVVSHRREASNPSARAEGNVENSPNLANYTPTTASTDADSPSKHFPETPGSALWSNRSSQQRLSESAGQINENGRHVWTQDALRNLGDGQKHSRNTSREYLSDAGRESTRHASPHRSPGPQPVKPAQQSISSSVPRDQARYYQQQGHYREPSADAQAGRPRNALENARPSTLETGGRSTSNDAPSSAKEHKTGLFSRLRKPKREEGRSPDDSSLDSPTSPVEQRQKQTYLKSGLNSSEVSLALGRERSRSSLVADEERTIIRAGTSLANRKFAMVTCDGWTYRMVDLTGIETPAAVRQAIMDNLGAPQLVNTSLHLTALGQAEHEEALSDDLLMFARKNMGDNQGTLKIFANIPHDAMPAGLAIAGNSPLQSRMSVTGKPLGEALLARLKEGQMNSPTISSGEPTLVQNKGDALAKNISPAEPRGPRPEKTWEITNDHTLAEREKILSQAADRHRKESELKQKAYLEARKANAQQQHKRNSDPSASPSIIGGGVDFDKGRPSPYADQKPFESRHSSQRSRDLVPNRPPPPMPPKDSNTLIKVNSLSKKNSGHRPRRSEGEDYKRRSNESTILESGENADDERQRSSGKNGSDSSSRPRAMQTVYNGSGRNSPGGSPRSPGQLTMSKGNIPFMIPDYDSGTEADDFNYNGNGTHMSTGSNGKPTLTLITNPMLDRLKQQGKMHSPEVSPATAHPQETNLSRMSSRRSYGPTFEFKEAPVQWKTTAAPVDDEEDSDSDDSLFAVKLRKAPEEKATVGTEDDREDASRMDVDPDAGNKASRKHSVRFQPTPTSTSPDGAESDHREMQSATARTPQSAEDRESKFLRRQSFASDIWANRPPAEGIVDHLDEFFPNINLDQPVIEGEIASPTSPGGDGVSLSKGPEDYGVPKRDDWHMSSLDENGTLGSDQSTLKRGDTVTSIAQRNMRKSGGLGRTRSIREVVQSAYHQPPIPPPPKSFSGAAPTRVNTLRQSASGAIVRRKSTKMFGAKIEQVKPQSRGSRLIQLETIPQDSMMPSSSGQGPTPQRQATFKWMKGQLIGKGTFGRVYLGMNMTTGELIAVKQVEVNAKAAGQDKERIKEMVRSLDIEIDTMQHLDHPNIVSYLGCERKEYSISIFLEYISGGSIGSCLRKHGKFEESVVSSLTRQTLDGLAYLHNEGILHRDLKADNILLDIDGTSKISDFGISKKSNNIYGNDVTNNMQGSVFWMAPEVIRSQGQGYSAKVDIWSLGCVVLEMFAGRRPWSKEEVVGAIYKLGSLNQAPPIPEEVSSNIGPAALSFMLDCFTM
jgi:mitogen-activated protein kinase kinase kinase